MISEIEFLGRPSISVLLYTKIHRGVAFLVEKSSTCNFMSIDSSRG